jgi:hypothetical protein
VGKTWTLGRKPINGVFAKLGAQAGMHSWMVSEGESVPCSKLGHVVGDGVQPQMERQSMLALM